jgi:hypothetical protein
VASLNDTPQLKKHLTYWTLVLILNYGLTFGIHYLLRPLWFDKTDEHTGLTTIETLFTIAIFPFALVTINYLLTKRFDKKHFFLINAIIICSCIIISSRLHFLNWADSVGSRTHPDGETLEVVAFERTVGLLVTAIGIIIAFVRLYRKKKVILST